MAIDQRAYWVWLQHALQAGSSKTRHILESFENLEAFYRAGLREWSLMGIFTQRELAALRTYTLQDALAQIDLCQKLGQHILTPEDRDYPFLLRQIHNPPAVLYVQGRLPDFLEFPSVSIVGTRKATLVGKRVAHSLGYGLAKGGAIVVSGGALGIDTAAHKGALLAGGKTVCVLGCGISHPYLLANADLRDSIAQNGALLSEYPPHTPALRNHFPVRNRLISGLTLGTVVVEATEKSGSLITANEAIHQNRDIFAVPGLVGSRASQGPNNLLREGMRAVSCANDILQEYLFRFPGKIHLEESTESVMLIETAQKEQKTVQGNTEDREEPAGLSPYAAALFRVLTCEPRPFLELCQEADIPTVCALPAVTELELAGIIQGYSGRRYSLKES